MTVVPLWRLLCDDDLHCKTCADFVLFIYNFQDAYFRVCSVEYAVSSNWKLKKDCATAYNENMKYNKYNVYVYTVHQLEYVCVVL